MKSPRKEVSGGGGSDLCELKYFSPHIRSASFLTSCLPAAVAMTMKKDVVYVHLSQILSKSIA